MTKEAQLLLSLQGTLLFFHRVIPFFATISTHSLIKETPRGQCVYFFTMIITTGLEAKHEVGPKGL